MNSHIVPKPQNIAAVNAMTPLAPVILFNDLNMSWMKTAVGFGRATDHPMGTEGLGAGGSHSWPTGSVTSSMLARSPTTRLLITSAAIAPVSIPNTCRRSTRNRTHTWARFGGQSVHGGVCSYKQGDMFREPPPKMKQEAFNV